MLPSLLADLGRNLRECGGPADRRKNRPASGPGGHVLDVPGQLKRRVVDAHDGEAAGDSKPVGRCISPAPAACSRSTKIAASRNHSISTADRVHGCGLAEQVAQSNVQRTTIGSVQRPGAERHDSHFAMLETPRQLRYMPRELGQQQVDESPRRPASAVGISGVRGRRGQAAHQAAHEQPTHRAMRCKTVNERRVLMDASRLRNHRRGASLAWNRPIFRGVFPA